MSAPRHDVAGVAVPTNASRSLRRQLTTQPEDGNAAFSYGDLALAAGSSAEAALWLSAAVSVRLQAPQHATALQKLAHIHFNGGRLERAAALLDRAAASRPTAWELWNDLGVVEDRRGRSAEARAAFRKASAVQPDATIVLGNQADLSFRLGDFIDAQRLAARCGQDPDASTTAGNCALRLGHPDAAARFFRMSLALAPSSVAAVVGLAVARMSDERMTEAGEMLARGLAVDPQDVTLNNNLATWHLVRGEFPRGFDLYEWRWRRPEAAPRRQGLPEWQGEPLQGRALVLYQEQGLGDVLQMVRYVPALALLARVTIECQPSLHRLLAGLAGRPTLVEPGQVTEADVQAPLMSLPRLLRDDPRAGPSPVPYLAADPLLVASTAPLVTGSGRRIGLVWQGNPKQVDEPHRSIPLALLEPLLALDGATFYGLQREHGREQMETFLRRGRLVDLGPALDDLATTAAVLMRLDLVITTCTAMAHLAGALGRPVWILLKRGADWRWMLDRTDSPWYPTARLIRQMKPGDWRGVASQLTEMTRAWLG